jgi:hypothetical protein
MAFVRKKLVKGQTYHYLVKSRWEDGKPRQKVLAYLGAYPTVKAAYGHWKRQLSKGDSAEKRHAREILKNLELYL